jgi:hypothetical protein
MDRDTMRYLSPPQIARAADAAGLADRLAEINRRIAAFEDVRRIVDFLFERTRDLCPGDRVGAAVLEEGGRRLVSHYSRADYSPLLLADGYAQDLRDSSLAELLHRGRPRIIDDLPAYLDAHPESRSTRLLVAEGVRSNLAVPLSVEGRNVGVLFRSSRESGSFREAAADAHLQIAERLGQAVEKALRIEQLAAANHAYTQTLAFVTHELKSPAASMVTEARLIEGGHLGEVPEAVGEHLRRICRKGEYMLDLVGEYLQLARIEGGDLSLNRQRVGDLAAEVIEPAVETVADALHRSRMRLVRDLPERPVALDADPTLLKIVLVNLLGNAAKYGREGGECRVSLEETDRAVRFGVRNDGPGFEPADQARLFKRFSRLDRPGLRDKPGTGVGLYTCWRLVHLHGGRIRARSEPGSWAEFSFEIPRQIPDETS